jgi:hypothetical protein
VAQQAGRENKDLVMGLYFGGVPNPNSLSRTQCKSAQSTNDRHFAFLAR